MPERLSLWRTMVIFTTNTSATFVSNFLLYKYFESWFCFLHQVRGWRKSPAPSGPLALQDPNQKPGLSNHCAPQFKLARNKQHDPRFKKFAHPWSLAIAVSVRTFSCASLRLNAANWNPFRTGAANCTSRFIRSPESPGWVSGRWLR